MFRSFHSAFSRNFRTGFMGIYQIPATGRSRIQESATAPLQSPLAGKPSPQTNPSPGSLCGPRKHPWNPLESLDPRRIPPHREIPLELEAVLLSISLWHSLYLFHPTRHPLSQPSHTSRPHDETRFIFWYFYAQIARKSCSNSAFWNAKKTPYGLPYEVSLSNFIFPF